jgi:O-antigen/teichoic acid export membrane protein
MVVIALGQIATVPLFLSAWGTSLYGEWLVISTIPAYLAMSDFGLGPVAANRVAMLSGNSERERAIVTLHSIWALQLVVGVVIVLLSVGISWTLPLHDWLDLKLLSVDDLRWAIIGLTGQVMLTMLTGVFQAVYRSSLRNARGAMMINTVRLAEVIASITVLGYHGGVWILVLTVLLVRAAGLFFLFSDIRRCAPDLPLGVSAFSAQELRELLKPAFGQVKFSLATALQLQGFTLLTNHLLGPVAVATYNILRTITRTCSQAVLVVNWSVYPEFSTLVAQRALDKGRTLHRIAVQFSVWGSFLFCVLLVLLGRQLITTWTLGRVAYDPFLFALFGSGVVLNSFWGTSSVVLTSTNNHATLGNIYALWALLGLMCGYAVGSTFGLHGIGMAALLAEFGMLGYVFRASCRLLDDPVGDAASNIFNPLVLIRRLLKLPRSGLRGLSKA